MPEAIFRCQSRREFRGARMNAAASVNAQWVGLSASTTAKVKKIYLFDINIRIDRFGLLIFPMPKMGNG